MRAVNDDQRAGKGSGVEAAEQLMRSDEEGTHHHSKAVTKHRRKRSFQKQKLKKQLEIFLLRLF